jgi:hypothetical protein
VPDLWAAALTFHGAILVGSLAAFPKYGDRTDLIEKSLKGTKEAVDALLAYLGSALAASVAPTVAQIAEDVNRSPQNIIDLLKGESFKNNISAFITNEIDEMVQYRSLVRARDRWSGWARCMSWSIWALIALEAILTLASIVSKVTSFSISLVLLLWSFGASAVLCSLCLISAAAMLYHHDQISKYRRKIL